MKTKRLDEFLDAQNKPDTRGTRAILLSEMTNEELDYLIERTDNHTGKAFFSSFKK